jgi:Skp family chaperone for outer membrane proteins
MELLSKMSPEEIRRASELHAQQGAIAASGFGTAQAAAEAGIVQQGQILQAVQAAAARGVQADADCLMAMSPEELADWDRSMQRSNMDEGQVPW